MNELNVNTNDIIECDISDIKSMMLQSYMGPIPNRLTIQLQGLPDITGSVSFIVTIQRFNDVDYGFDITGWQGKIRDGNINDHYKIKNGILTCNRIRDGIDISDDKQLYLYIEYLYKKFIGIILDKKKK